MDEVGRITERLRGQKMEVSYRPYNQIVEEEAKETIELPNKFWLQTEIVHALDKAGEGVIGPVDNNLAPSGEADVGGGESQEVLVTATASGFE